MSNKPRAYFWAECLEVLYASFQESFEVGGFLLGTRDVWQFTVCHIFMIPAIGTKGKLSVKSSCYETELIEVLIQHPGLEIIGIWHTHPMGETIFSLTDQITNKAYAEYLDGCLSVIVNSPESIYPYCIEKDRVVSLIKLEGDTSNGSLFHS